MPQQESFELRPEDLPAVSREPGLSTAGSEMLPVAFKEVVKALLANLEQWQMWQKIVANQDTEEDEIIDETFQVEVEAHFFSIGFTAKL
jgi:hypothetical protein